MIGPARLDLGRIRSMARKEMLHILRDRTTLFFALFIPVLQLTMLGFAIDTNVRHVRTMVYDQARTQESRALLQRFENSEDFRIVGEVFTDEELTEPWSPAGPASGSRSPRTTRGSSRPGRPRRC